MSKNAKKIINLFCVLVSCVMLSQLLVGCEFIDGRLYRRSPYTASFQRMTKWMSEDEKMYFEVDENGFMIGYILVEQEKIEIDLDDKHGSSLIVYDINKPITEYTYGGRYIDEQECEHLSCRYLKEDMFLATVKEATYLTVGETLVFHKIEDLKPEDDFHSN